MAISSFEAQEVEYVPSPWTDYYNFFAHGPKIKRRTLAQWNFNLWPSCRKESVFYFVICGSGAEVQSFSHISLITYWHLPWVNAQCQRWPSNISNSFQIYHQLSLSHNSWMQLILFILWLTLWYHAGMQVSHLRNPISASHFKRM